MKAVKTGKSKENSSSYLNNFTAAKGKKIFLALVLVAWYHEYLLVSWTPFLCFLRLPHDVAA